MHKYYYRYIYIHKITILYDAYLMLFQIAMFILACIFLIQPVVALKIISNKNVQVKLETQPFK